MSKTWSGGCQCGSVRYQTTSLVDNAHICHCRMCQKAVGNFFAALVSTPKAQLVWTRGEPKKFQSSALVERGFCEKCGTPLFYNDQQSENIGITIGSLDQPENVQLVSQDGIEGRMPWFANILSLHENGKTADGDQAAWAKAIEETSRQHPDHDTDRWP
jgi:hypothetical protein